MNIGILLKGLLISWVCATLSAQSPTAEISPSSASYTKEQAKSGEEQYMKACASCHLPDLSGQYMAPPLASDSFVQNYEGRSVADLFERIRATMPQDAVGTLTDQAYVEIVAFLLQANRFPLGTQPLVTHVDELKKIIVKRRP